MALIKCPECQNKISDSALICPKCGLAINRTVKDQIAAASKKSTSIKIAIAVAIGILIIAAALSSNPTNPPSATSTATPKTDEEVRRKKHCQGDGSAIWDAEYMAKQFVTDGLKSPSTAKYPEIKATYTGGCSFFVTGKVDAQNVFGAMLRNNFTIKLTYRPEDNKWWRDSMDIFP